jgi:hypothetical protein
MFPPASGRLNGVLRHPLLGAAGYLPLQDSTIRWAHPRAYLNNNLFFIVNEI